MDRDLEASRGPPHRSAVSQKQRSRMVLGDAQSLYLAIVERLEQRKRQEFRESRSAWWGMAPRKPRTAKGREEGPLNLTLDRNRYDHPREVEQKIDAPQFIQTHC